MEKNQRQFEKDTYKEAAKQSYKNKARALVEYDLRRNQARIKANKKAGALLPLIAALFMCVPARQDDDEPNSTTENINLKQNTSRTRTKISQ